MAPVFAGLAVEGGVAVADDRIDAAVELHGGDGEFPLRGGKVVDIAGKAHAAEEGGGERVGEALRGVVLAQHGPDLRLAREDEALDIRGDDRDFPAFVRIGK